MKTRIIMDSIFPVFIPLDPAYGTEYYDDSPVAEVDEALIERAARVMEEFDEVNSLLHEIWKGARK